MSRRKQIILISAFALLTLMTLVCMIAYSSLGGRLETQLAAERWAGEGEESMAQISCFFQPGSEPGESALQTFRNSVDAKLRDAAIDVPENGSLYRDAWCALGSISVKGDKGQTTATAVGVGGDFFFFHPLTIRSGSYIGGDDLMRDRVVLDEEMAWKLFGAIEVAGFTVTIDGRPYLVAAVVTREGDGFSAAANAADACIYVPYELLAEKEIAISAYEIVMPNPISGFAYGVVREAFAEPVQVTENSRRFGVPAIFDVLRDLSGRTVISEGMAYPYWENAARLVENRLAVILLITAILGIYPIVCVTAAVVFIAKRLWSKIKRTAVKAVNSNDERRYREYVRKTAPARRQTDGEHNAEEAEESL